MSKCITDRESPSLDSNNCFKMYNYEFLDDICASDDSESNR